MTKRHVLLAALMLAMFAMGSMRARADAALLMEEPYGIFGAINPTGHAAIYLNNICAETPVQLRPCRAGEPGAVISRYHKIDGYDWLAIPLVPYLYAVENVKDVPGIADAELEAKLRNQYRRDHLMEYAPDIAKGPKAGEDPKGDWTELVGASYDRRIYGFQVLTSPEEDANFIARFNDQRNASHFNLFFHNCADFSRVLLDTYYPHSVHRNFFVDFGLTTPKQVARSLTKYAKKHPEAELTTFMIPQVPGTIKRSHPIDGVLESVVKSKKYVLPLAVVNPEVTAGLVVAYLTAGRFHAPKDTPSVMIPEEVARPAEGDRPGELQRRVPAAADSVPNVTPVSTGGAAGSVASPGTAATPEPPVKQ